MEQGKAKTHSLAPWEKQTQPHDRIFGRNDNEIDIRYDIDGSRDRSVDDAGTSTVWRQRTSRVPSIPACTNDVARACPAVSCAYPSSADARAALAWSVSVSGSGVSRATADGRAAPPPPSDA